MIDFHSLGQKLAANLDWFGARIKFLAQVLLFAFKFHFPFFLSDKYRHPVTPTSDKKTGRSTIPTNHNPLVAISSRQTTRHDCAQ